MSNLKTIIVYYSFSGNTRKIALSINQGLGKAASRNDIVAIKGHSGIPGMKPIDLLNYDLIGIGSPVWFECPTPNMMAFINVLPSLKGKQAFVFITHGLEPDITIRWMVRALQKKKATVIGWKDWYGAAYPPDMFKPYYTDGHPDQIDITEAVDFGREMVDRSRRIMNGEISLVPDLPSRAEYNRIYGVKKVVSPRAGRVEYEIKINMNKCSLCGLCIEHCPTGSIDFTRTDPINRLTCKACWVCEQICPLGAVEIDYDAIIEAQSRKWGENWKGMVSFQRGRKHAMEDLRFRPLVTSEDIGKNGYWYQLSGHPRFKILP
jgi:ferredoxin/flavodoxin